MLPQASAAQRSAASAAREHGLRDPLVEKFPLEALRQGLVSSINEKVKEMYLADDEFERVVGMPPDEFYRLKQWQQRQLKQKLDLF